MRPSGMGCTPIRADACARTRASTTSKAALAVDTSRPYRDSANSRTAGIGGSATLCVRLGAAPQRVLRVTRASAACASARSTYRRSASHGRTSERLRRSRTALILPPSVCMRFLKSLVTFSYSFITCGLRHLEAHSGRSTRDADPSMGEDNVSARVLLRSQLSIDLNEELQKIQKLNFQKAPFEVARQPRTRGAGS